MRQKGKIMFTLTGFTFKDSSTDEMINVPLSEQFQINFLQMDINKELGLAALTGLIIGNIEQSTKRFQVKKTNSD